MTYFLLPLHHCGCSLYQHLAEVVIGCQSFTPMALSEAQREVSATSHALKPKSSVAASLS